MDNHDLLISVLNWEVMFDADKAMDAELANAKKKQGVCMKYKAMIPARAWDENYAEPFNVGSPDDKSTPWFIAAIAIGMDMRDRLKAFAGQHGVMLHG